MNWKGKKVLVTGAGGFIGSHLTERLVERGSRVRAFVHYNALGSWGWLDESPVRDDIEAVTGNVCDRDSVGQAMRDTEIVFHLAALIGIPYSYHAPVSYVRTNIEGTLNVLQSARELGVERVIHTSTSEAYGTARYVPIDENHPLQGQSPYSATKIGSDKLTIIDNPFIANGLGSRLYDGDGMAARRRPFLEKGVLKAYFISYYYSRKLSMEPTTGGYSNLVFENGRKTLTEMIKDVKKGILVTSFIGGNSNSLTGDFSYGIIGTYIEDGKLIKPVNEMNISGNQVDLWNQLVELGNDPYKYSSLRRPSLRFKDVQFSGL